MCPCVTSMISAGWVCVLLAVVSADSENSLYKKVGDEVVLKPGSVPGPITSIMWKDGPNIAAQWDGAEPDYYRQFKERGRLNISTGELTITGLTRNDSGLYTPEINNNLASPTRLIVISPVPTPTVGKSCDDEKTSCTLSCDGDTAGAEPVTYRWKSGDVVLTGETQEKRITKDNSSEFSCELENPVSLERSQPILNPFTIRGSPEAPIEVQNLKISTGVTVFICLLTAVLLLVFIHRWKAGMWFFHKASMPWEADFWRKPPRDAAESNGTTAYEETGQTDEETPMK